MIRPTRFLAGIAVLVATLLVVGCGGEPEPEHYRLEPTRDCLEEAGIDISTEELDFVASTATAGAFRAELEENEVTVTFAETDDEAERTVLAYRNFAGPTIAIDHVLFRHANVVMVWHAPPSDEERGRAEACLEG